MYGYDPAFVIDQQFATQQTRKIAWNSILSLGNKVSEQFILILELLPAPFL